tara:strand:- start:520 stop:1080 length:561 start_codon:yes stop_codon:yes gene_type:complete
MSEEYKNDRKWSDKIFYDSAKSEILKSLNLSQLFGIVTNIEPASQEDDNDYNIDTYINKISTQVRLQRSFEKKDNDYYPTLRYGRPYDTSTEVRKMIKMYDSYLKTGNHKMPKYLLWGMIDEKNKLVEIKLIDLRELFEDRWIAYNKDDSYRMTKDHEKFVYKENNDGTSFLIIKTDKYTKYHYER